MPSWWLRRQRKLRKSLTPSPQASQQH